MHIELLATFRGLSGPEGVVEAKNLRARLIGGPIDSLCYGLDLAGLLALAREDL